MKRFEGKKNTSPLIPKEGSGEAMEIWIDGFRRPVIGKITGIYVIEGEEGDDLNFIIDDGSEEEITISVDSIRAIGEFAANAA